MLNILAWLILQLIIKTFCVFTEYDLCQHKESLKRAKEICAVPSISDLNSKQEEITIAEFLPTNEAVWTSTQVMTSDWAKFHGCIDTPLELNNATHVTKLLNEIYFPNETDTTTSAHVTIQYCSYHCSGRGNYFVYVMNTCKCLNDIELYKYEIDAKSKCLQACKNTNSPRVFCSSGMGLPVFKFKKDLEQQLIRSDHITGIQQQCLKRGNNRTMIATDCALTNPFTCKCHNNTDIQPGNWTSAVNWCLEYNSTIQSDRLSEEKENVWLGYFLLLNATMDERNCKCVAMSIYQGSDTKRSLSYQYRNCSDMLHVVCIDKVSMAIKCIPSGANETITTHANTMFVDLGDLRTYGSIVQHNNHITTVGDQSPLGISKTLITIASIVLFVLLLMVICLIIFSRLKITLRQRRNQPDPDIGIHSNTASGASAQINVNENYANPWDICHNIAEIEGIYHEVSDSIEAEYSESKV